MPSQSQADNEEHNESLLMSHNAPVKRSSLQCQASILSREKASSLPERKPSKPGKTKQNGPDQHAATADKIGIRNAVPVMPLGNHHKPCPSKKATGVDDVVKYMSSVPSYLQRLEKGDSVQEKALNFGVLDWGCLEKWTYLQKQVANRSERDSPSSTNSSSSASFSTFASTSQSTRSTYSPFAQRKQSPKLNAHRKSSVEGQQTEQIDEQNSVQVMSNPDSKTSCGGPSEKGKIRYSNTKGISIDNSQPQDISSSSSTSKVNDIPVSAHHKVKSQVGRSRGSEKFLNCEQQSFPGNLYFAEGWLQDQCSVVEGMWDHLQESEHARRISYDSATVNNGRCVEASRNSFSGNFPPSDYQFSNQPLNIPYSCPLPSTRKNDEPCVSNTLLSENEVLPASAKGKHMKLGQFTESLLGKSVVNMADKSGHGEVKLAAAPRRELSPHRLLHAGLSRIRSSTLREGSSGQQMKRTIISDNSHEDNATSQSSNRRSVTPQRLLSAGLNRIRNSSLREGSSGKEMKQTNSSDNSQGKNAASGSSSRYSPLRRILDPLLKSKNQILFSGSCQRAEEVGNEFKQPILVESKSVNEPCKSSDANINSLPSQVSEAGCSVQDKKQVISTRQALLKLAWKNGLPLFVFSANDNNILAATMRKGSISHKNDFSCIYTMFTAHEVKKKGGVSMIRGNKSKKHDLAYNVVSRMKVSSSKYTSIGSQDNFFMREFVLYGSELAPATRECANSRFNNELAAIVIQVPNEGPENNDALQSNNFRDSSCSTENLHVKQKNDNSGLASVVAILPSGVHGISSTGEPSPLIERWKSGGVCDCGGWDEGCMLTVLTEKNISSSQDCSPDETRRIELFPQVEDGENKHTFRMTAFKEGVYTVEFGASITLSQAFAMCIAILHSRKPHTLSLQHYSMKAQSIQYRISTEYNSQTTAPTSYVPERPPLSPVRRA